MHVAVLQQEYNPKYKIPEELSEMKGKGVKLLEDDMIPDSYHERIICCHILDMDENTNSSRDRNLDRFESDEEMSMEEHEEVKKSSYRGRRLGSRGESIGKDKTPAKNLP